MKVGAAGHPDGDYAALADAAETIRGRGAAQPRVALVLGTGLGGLADAVAAPTIIPYAEIPGFPKSTVAGHAGQLVLGELAGVPVVAMQGRFHLYEGYTPQQVVFPIRVFKLLGVEILIVTNAAGGLDAQQRAGDLMLLTDHIGLATMVGLNPLLGPNDERLGPRFPAMTNAYDPELRRLALEAAAAAGVTLRQGVYVMLSGPNYETPAEYRFLRGIGANAVGLSTVPEVIAARHLGLRVLAVSCITNVALGADVSAPPGAVHSEVVDVAMEAGPRLAQVIAGMLRRL